MIFKDVLRYYLIGYSGRLLNSTIVMGLYFGFLSTFSLGPAYFFLIRAQISEKDPETKIAATTGFITGQLIMFMSIYYTPLHLALNRPHTFTALGVPYVVFYFIQKNNKYYYSGGFKLDFEYKNPNSIRRNLSIISAFVNNLVFQLLNPLLFPSSILIRLMNMYLFRAKNQLLFLTSSFVGWLIGHILVTMCIGLVLVSLQQKSSIKSQISMRIDKYTLLQLRNYSGQIFVVFSFVLVGHCLGRIPMPYSLLTDTKEYDERDMEEGGIDSENQEMNNDDLSVYFSGDTTNIEKNKLVEKAMVTTLFDFQRWSRPFRYIKNDHFERVVRDENSQFFFNLCQSDGKNRISFTYPPHISTFIQMIEKKMDLFKRDKSFENNKELSNSWSSINKAKLNQFRTEFVLRAKMIDKHYNRFSPADFFENRIRLSDDKSKRKYLSKIYDPFLNGPFRGESQKSCSPCISNQTDASNCILINQIHGLLITNYPEFEQKIDQVDRKLFLTEMGFLFNLMTKFSEKSVSSFNFDGSCLFPEHEQVKIYFEEKEIKRDFLLESIETDPTNNTIFNRQLCTGINEICKEVPRWSYKLIDDLDVLMDDNPEEAQILGPKAERIVILSGKTDSLSSTSKINKKDDNKNVPDDSQNIPETTELAITYYSREPDFNRELIKGSMVPLRRKTTTLKLFQPNIHSPVFFEIMDNYPFFFMFGDLFYEISQYLKEIFRKPGTDNSEFLQFQKQMEEKEIEEKKDEAENRRRKIEEAWESILYGLIIRSFVLLFQSLFRRYVLFPLLIISKNIIRMLLFQNPEWSEDFRDLRRELHIICTYQGVPVSENALPPNWFFEGIQIRILFPFVIKPWHNKVKSPEKIKKGREKKSSTQKTPVWFLTGFGTRVESYLEEHVPNPLLFFGPSFKKIKKYVKKDLTNRFFLVLKFFNNIKMLEDKKGDQLSESTKNSTLSTKSNSMIEESPVIIESSNWTNYSFTELTDKRIKDLNIQTHQILKEIEKITEERKGGVLTLEIKTPSDAQKLELKKNSWQVFKRRNVRLIRKSYSYFKILMLNIYRFILLSSINMARIHGQRFSNYIELTKNGFISIYNKLSYKKKHQERVLKGKKSISRFMSTIEKVSKIRGDLNSQNSCDVSSLSQAYVLFKLSQIQVSNGYGYKSKLRSILESPETSLMKQWTKWLKVHSQYALPDSVWSRLVAQKWRNKVREYRAAKKKDLVEYDSTEKRPLVFYKKQERELLTKKKIRKQYGYDLFAYQYLNSVKLEANKNQTMCFNYNIPKNTKELFDIIGNSLLDNYLAGDGIKDRNISKYMQMDRDKKMGRKYLMGIKGEGKKNSITNQKFLTPTFRFFSKLSAYKKNPWILPINFFFVEFLGNQNITDRVGLAVEKKEYASQEDLESFISNYYKNSRYNINKFRNDLIGERNFLLDKYFCFYLDCKAHFQDTMMDNINFYCLLMRLKRVKQFFIMSIKKEDLDLETMVRIQLKDSCYTECRDTYELRDNLIFLIEPLRISRNNYEKVFLYQMISISFKHKRKILKRNSEQSRRITETKDQKNYDFLIPENLFSTRRRRELRILICLNLQNRNTVPRNYNDQKIKNSSSVLTENEYLNRERKKLINLKFFLWPNYRFEDLACMNRYWFDTHNGSRWSILRLHIYPRLKT